MIPCKNRTVELREPNVMEVLISELPKNSVILKINRLVMSGLTKGAWNRSCDFMILTHEDGLSRVLFIELKLTLSDPDNGLEQLRRSLPTAKYLLSLCSVAFSGIDLRQVEVRYSLVATKVSPRLDKQPVRKSDYTEIRSYKDINVSIHIVPSQIRFNRLWEQNIPY